MSKSISFIDPLILAILEGRKTQTRRIIKPQPEPSHWDSLPSYRCTFVCSDNKELWRFKETIAENPSPIFGKTIKAPYLIGEKVYVREAWAWKQLCGGLPFITFRATDPEHPFWWRPSIHMPEKHSRITIIPTSVSAQRLQKITEEDARSEGLKALSKDGSIIKYGMPDRDGLPGTENTGWEWADWNQSPRVAFARLWNQIYAPWRPIKRRGVIMAYESYPWDNSAIPPIPAHAKKHNIPCAAYPNPWVFRYEFRMDYACDSSTKERMVG